MGTTLMSVFSLLAGIIIAFIYGWKLTLALLVAVPLLMIASGIQMKMRWGLSVKNKKALEVGGKVRRYINHFDNISTL